MDNRWDPDKLREFTEDLGDPADYRIIVAEDSPLIRQQIKDSLEAGGFTNLLMCQDGREAYDHIMEEGPCFDVLITDVEMPRLDGLSLTRRLKENDVSKALPIIVFSSIMTQDIKMKAASVGAKYQITKPEISKLVEYVAEVIRERQLNAVS